MKGGRAVCGARVKRFFFFFFPNKYGSVFTLLRSESVSRCIHFPRAPPRRASRPWVHVNPRRAHVDLERGRGLADVVDSLAALNKQQVPATRRDTFTPDPRDSLDGNSHARASRQNRFRVISREKIRRIGRRDRHYDDFLNSGRAAGGTDPEFPRA